MANRFVSTYDVNAEEIVIRGLLYPSTHLVFDEVYYNVKPEYFGGSSVDQKSGLLKDFFKTIVMLRDKLHTLPTPDIIKKELIRDRKITQVHSDIAYLEKLLVLQHPTEINVRDAYLRMLAVYDNRCAASTCEEALDMLSRKGGTAALEHMRSAGAARTRNLRKEFKVFDYVDEYGLRKRYQVEAQSNMVTGPKRIPFGIHGLDAATGGAGPGEFIVIAGATGGGKTISLQDIAAHMVEQGLSVAFFSKEMVETELGYRFDSRFSGVQHPHFFEHQLSQNEFSIWDATMQNIPKNRLKLIIMNRNFTVEQMDKALDSMEWNFRPDVVFADYIGIMHPSGGNTRGWEAKEIVCEELKDLGRDRSFPTISAAQLVASAREKLEITIEDIAVGKLAISQAADVIAAILSDPWLKAINKAVLQILKVRGKEPQRVRYDLFPDLNRIRIDTGFHQPPLPPGWQQLVDQSTGKSYFINPDGDSQWDAPQTLPPPKDPQKGVLVHDQVTGELLNAAAV